MIKVIVSDLDGTLLNSQSEMSENMYRAITKLQSKGYLFGLATGRPLFSIETAIPSAQKTFDFIIANNGGDVYDLKKMDHIEQAPLTGEMVGEIVEKTKKLGGNPILYLDGKMVTEKEDIYNRKVKDKLDVVYVSRIEDYIEDYHPKVIFSGPKKIIDRIDAQKHLETQDYKMIRSQDELIEFVNPNINKAKGLKTILDREGLSFEHLLAFGDNDNDVEMIQAAKIGVGMENASSLVKEHADVLTLHHNEDGVYDYLKRHLL